MRGFWILVVVFFVMTGCRTGTATRELEQLRARAATLEAENAHLQGQVTLMEAERDQLRQQVNTLATDLARVEGQRAAVGLDALAASENLVAVPSRVSPGEWVAVHVKNYPPRLLPMAGIALRGPDNKNISRISKLASANVFLLPIPKTVPPGRYEIVLAEAGTLGPSARVDDRVTIIVRGP